MAVRIDIEAFRESIPAAVGEAAARLLSNDSVGELELAGGGVQAVVRDHGGVVQPWIGIADGIFTGDCDCGMAGHDLCAHAVATALAAFDAGVAFSGAATPPGATMAEPEHARYLQAVQRLSPRQLANLVAEHALRDRLFATLLLGEAGLLDATDHTGLNDARAAIRDASNATTGSSWQISDVEAAGHRLAAEIEILCAWPATPAMLDLVEEAILVWDDLSGYLRDAYHITHTQPEEITEPLLDTHRDLYERLNLDPDEIAHRLTRLAERCHHDTVDIDLYADLLGEYADTISRPSHW
ncbi:MAG TPA: SWIM zinc finger family protein [Micromonospora sp.]|nr:SWIM zinc finger family protein [Micromonospora sp.]